MTGWKEQPIAFAVQLQAWLIDSAKIQTQYKVSHGFILLSFILHVRCKLSELLFEERPAPPANRPGSSATAGLEG